MELSKTTDDSSPAGTVECFNRNHRRGNILRSLSIETPSSTSHHFRHTLSVIVDEIDRADDEFEAFLLEVLAEFQITIPEIGTITATHKPTVILTSNATRDLSDALRRRCLYHFVDFPSYEKELTILQTHLPDIRTGLAESIVSFIQNLRQQDLKKTPGIAETLDWAGALLQIQVDDLKGSLPEIETTLGCLLKTRTDREQADEEWIRKVMAHTNNHDVATV